MDMAAHMLWVGASLVALSRRDRARAEATHLTGEATQNQTLDRRLVLLGLAFSVLPDLAHLLPVVVWALAGGGWSGLLAYSTALPGQEPAMPVWAEQAAHHLHCMFHSGLLLLALHLVVWVVWRIRGRRQSGWPTNLPWRLSLPLWAWWSHVLIDVVTHSDDFYPSPVLYPLTYAGLDGVAWNRPGFMLLNYLALGLTWAWLFRPWRDLGRR